MDRGDSRGLLKGASDIRIDRQPLPERVAEQLRKLILLEKLPPGVVINEREMASLLGVSRTPLREALRVLANEGLVVVEPNRPPRVVAPSLDELLQLIEVQAALEALAGELACRTASDRELQEVWELHQEMVAISDQADPIEFFELDVAFHKKIVEIAKNKPLEQTHSLYNSRLYRARFIASDRAVVRENTLKQHGEIAEALVARSEKQVSHALREHLRAAGKNIVWSSSRITA
jgi:DNA-binding GntR family transcriptional regulator